VDGTILFAAMAAFAAARTTGNAWLGMAAGALAGAFVAGVLAVWACARARSWPWDSS
jgi:simple sugar transport system permease protein